MKMLKLLLNICLVMITAAGETTQAAASSMAVAYVCKVTDYVIIVLLRFCYVFCA